MSTGTSLYFYITENCELCEQAEQVLVRTPLDTPLPVDVVDISESEELVQQYGERIPVLRMEPQGKELEWPFTSDDVIAFLGNH
ncbi:glutaredoxin family protein [Vreelandella utahensis]|uniref:glutaredoxin family protein n=1 Tax=Vreelandella halophila TaxID=86177 RepID=UPI0009869E94|nr:glutaredoxin family protein [Halomonas utahensis]